MSQPSKLYRVNTPIYKIILLSLVYKSCGIFGFIYLSCFQEIQHSFLSIMVIIFDIIIIKKYACIRRYYNLFLPELEMFNRRCVYICMRVYSQTYVSLFCLQQFSQRCYYETF